MEFFFGAVCIVVRTELQPSVCFIVLVNASNYFKKLFQALVYCTEAVNLCVRRIVAVVVDNFGTIVNATFDNLIVISVSVYRFGCAKVGVTHHVCKEQRSVCASYVIVSVFIVEYRSNIVLESQTVFIGVRSSLSRDVGGNVDVVRVNNAEVVDKYVIKGVFISVCLVAVF